MLPVENELHLRVTLERIAAMYGQAEREAAETLWDEEMRREMSEQTTHLREALEREVALYLAKKYHLTAETPTRKKRARRAFAPVPDKIALTQNA